MSKKANPTLVGAFVLGAVVLTIGALLTYGSSGLFKEKRPVNIVYFDGSLGGLDVGAPVQFKGVTIGQVKDISLVYNHEDDRIEMPVLFEVDPSKFKEQGAQMEEEPEGAMMQRHIDRGLRARLESLNMLTGKLKIELDYYPDTEPDFRSTQTEYREVPSIPTTLAQLTETLKEIPIIDTIEEIRSAVQGLEALITNEDLNKAFTGVNQTLVAVEGLVATLNHHVPMISTNITSTLGGLNKATDELDRTLKKAQSMMTGMEKEVDPIRYQFGLVLQEIQLATRSIRMLADSLEENPQGLLLGKPQEEN